MLASPNRIKAMKHLALILFFMGAAAHADYFGYGDSSCRTEAEQRGILREKDVCILDVSCYHYPLSNSNLGVRTKSRVYCHPDATNFCQEAQDCINETSIRQSEVVQIKPKYPELVASCRCQFVFEIADQDVELTGRLTSLEKDSFVIRIEDSKVKAPRRFLKIKPAVGEVISITLKRAEFNQLTISKMK